MTKDSNLPRADAPAGIEVRLSAAPGGPADDMTDGDGVVISETVGHVTVVTARLFDRMLANRLREYGVPIGQFPFLLFLWADETLSQRDLSRLMSIEESTVTNTIDRMVRDGLVLRERASDDLRRNRLKLTRRGQQLREVVLPQVKGVAETATAGMSKAEVFFLLSLLRKVQANLMDEGAQPLSV